MAQPLPGNYLLKAQPQLISKLRSGRVPILMGVVPGNGLHHKLLSMLLTHLLLSFGIKTKVLLQLQCNFWKRALTVTKDSRFLEIQPASILLLVAPGTRLLLYSWLAQRNRRILEIPTGIILRFRRQL